MAVSNISIKVLIKKLNAEENTIGQTEDRPDRDSHLARLDDSEFDVR
jgi:hypothetical protein